MMAGQCPTGEETSDIAERIQRNLQSDSDWEYPPVRLKDGTELTSLQVRWVIQWYWKSGQAREDIEGSR